MKFTPVIVLVFSLFAAAISFAQKPATTDAILKEAYAKASKENKKVLIIFHASWCGWCKKMDSSLNDISCKQFFEDNYVIRHLAVYETKDNKYLENPGAFDLLKKYNGEDQGIPYWLIFDKDGQLLADSKMRPEGAGFDSKGDNCGCPAEKNEVSYFINILRQTSNLTNEEAGAIEKRFRQNLDQHN